MALGAHGVHELAKGLLEVLNRAVVVEVVRLDVGDDGHGRVEVEERAVGLVGLGDVVLRPAAVRVGVIALYEPTDEERRVEAHAVEHRRDHGARRGLAVGARDGHSRVAQRQRRQHLGARPDLDAQLAGADDLGVRLGDGRGDHDDVGPHGVDGGGLVANVDLDASGLELADVARALEVAARHDDAALVQDERDAAHARATDADDVDALERKLL